MHGPAHPAEDAAPVAAQALSKPHQRRDLAFLGMPEPLFPGRPPLPRAGGVPQPLELGLHQVHGHQRLVGAQQFLQVDLLLGLAQVFRIAQQQPARLLDDPPRRFVVT
ncbi:hypothetical protein D3C72_2110330 [compost metagenome]